MIATAPGKLMLTGEYAVLDGAPALVIAIDRRVRARRQRGPRGSSPFLIGVADEIAKRFGADHPATQAALEIVVDSTSLFEGTDKLGLGSSAAVTVAATALALAADQKFVPIIDRELVASIAFEVHGNVQRARGATGSGADVAAAVHGGVIEFSQKKLERLTWPPGLTLVPFFIGVSADTPKLVAQVTAARAANPVAINAVLVSIAEISRAACRACAARAPEVSATALISALSLAARATDQLATTTRLPLVPPAVTAVRAVAASLGGTAKTTGAGGGDVAIAVIPATEDAAIVRRSIIEAGCQPLTLSLDHTGVDLLPDVQ
jgi:phosphomevalonate kinase